MTSADDLSEALAAARLGDESGFRLLYRAMQPPLLRYLYVLVGTEAEDVASDTWLRVVRDLGGFQGEVADFRRWAATIARYRAIDHLRRHSRLPISVGSDDDLLDRPDMNDTANLAIQNLTTEDSLALIARLPLDQAEAVALRVVFGLDAESAGHVLGKRPGAVRTAAHRGLRRLAEILGRSPAMEEVGATSPGRTEPLP